MLRALKLIFKFVVAVCCTMVNKMVFVLIHI